MKVTPSQAIKGALLTHRLSNWCLNPLSKLHHDLVLIRFASMGIVSLY